MSLRIGRLGMDVAQTNVAELTASGDDMSISGLVSAEGGFDSSSLREQIIALQDNRHEAFVPIIFDEHPWVNGYCTVTEASVDMNRAGALLTGWYPFSISVRRLATSAAPLMEARMLGSVRTNLLSITTCRPWQGIPDLATGYSGPASLTQETRPVSDGRVRLYKSATASSGGLLDAFTTFLVPPQNWYDGSARIRTGLLDRVSPTRFTLTGSAQTFTVPAGVTTVTVECVGASGAGRKHGRGGRTMCDLAVTAGETLYVHVGGAGSGRVGGYNGGSNGGTAYNAWFVGYGGGGASDVRQGGTTTADRVVVAGGGGGMGGANPTPDPSAGVSLAGYAGGHGGGVVGRSGASSGSGRGGQATVGGAAGVEYPGRSAGTAGTLLDGGAGRSETLVNYYAGGGGGGGLYGGGGGSGNVFMASGGSGGGGSGLSTGINETQNVGYRKGDGYVVITPVLDQPNIERYTVIGDQCPNSPLGWELSNGLVKILPVYGSGFVKFDTYVWSGTAWSPVRRWAVGDAGTTTCNASATAMVVITNTPEECVLQVTYEYTDKSEAFTIRFSLRRGSPLVGMAIYGASKQWAVRTDSWVSCSSATGRIYQTAPDADGNSLMTLTTYIASANITFNSGFSLASANDSLYVAIGFRPNWSSATTADLQAEHMAALTEDVKAVIR